MAEQDIIQNMIHQLGQSQGDRFPDELRADFSKIDAQSTADLLKFTRKFAASVNYYPTDPARAKSTWTNFFPDDAAIETLLKSETGSTPPHLALFLAFLKLYEKPQEVLNGFTGRHLDFFYRDVLRLAKKPAVPDTAHVLLELKKGSASLAINSTNVFSAGKDSKRVEMLYVPTGETIVSTAKVVSLRSLFRDTSLPGTVRCATVANSSDGVGGALSGSEQKWSAFGSTKLPPAAVGFALASPVLLMQEGKRSVTVKLTLGNLTTEVTTHALAAAFDVFITGAKNWLGPYEVSPAVSGSQLQFTFEIPETEAAVVDYNAKIHGYSYTATAPVIQVLLKAKPARTGYENLKEITVQTAQISVDVQNITSLNLESDDGVLNPKKAFQPFGPQPGAGSRFMIGCEEALQKKLDKLVITAQWKDAPEKFSDRYAGYSAGVTNNNYFTANVSFTDAGGHAWESSGEVLFKTEDARQPQTYQFPPADTSTRPVATLVPLPAASTAVLPRERSRPRGASLFLDLMPDLYSYRDVSALRTAGSPWTAELITAVVRTYPLYNPPRSPAPESRSGFITFSLNRDFLHSAYRTEYVRHMMEYSKSRAATVTLTVLQEPYTPTIQSIKLSYIAHSDAVNIASIDLKDFLTREVQFFHVAWFGQMREQGFQRSRFAFPKEENATDVDITLLPYYENTGELLIGLENLAARDSVSMLFQVAEGSADPELDPETITWSVLCNNYWKPLGSDGVVLDTTNGLLTSGIIKFVIPGEATTQNTILPAGLLWLRAGVAGNVTAVCQLIEVAANALEVRFADQGNDPAHLATALPAGSITQLKSAPAAVKTVKQPYASFDGSQEETDEGFRRRVSERLRHKGRCITPWDYERIILEAFPNVHKVKCIPHACEGSWLAPGHVMVVVVPDLRNRNAMNPLEPKVDSDTIKCITEFAQARAGMAATVKARNPAYQKIELEFAVRFHEGFEFNFYSGQLNQRLIEFLSPWAFDSRRDISFDSTIYKSVLLDFVEEIEWVDYVEDFRMYTYAGERRSADLNEVRPAAPDMILVSAGKHILTDATPAQKEGTTATSRVTTR